MKKAIIPAIFFSMIIMGCGRRDTFSVKLIEEEPVAETSISEPADINESNTINEVNEDNDSSENNEADRNNETNEDMNTDTANTNKATVKNLLKASLEPVGSTLYVYGGAWNEEDTAAGVEAMTLGVSSRWKEFFASNDSTYNYKGTRYQIHDGLDCTGLIGYATYQLFENEYSDNGYVFTSKTMASEYAKLFNGTMYYPGGVNDYEPGDIMAGGSGHAFIIIGQCDDGSILFVHASPPCVTLSGSATPSGETNSQAYQLAHQYMSTYYPESHNRYENCSRGTGYLTDYNQMRWNPEVLSDPDGYRNMSVNDIMLDLFNN